MRKLSWIFVLMMVSSTFALAQNFSFQGAFGVGSAGAPDAEEPNALFSLAVSRLAFGSRTWQGGYFSLQTRVENQLVSVLMTRLEELAVDAENRTASFSGQAVLAVRTRSGYTRVRGTVQVSVWDNRSRDGSGDPDMIVLTFTDEEGNLLFSYSGEVKGGDIAVFANSSRR